MLPDEETLFKEKGMAYRKRLSKKRSRRSFRRGASRTHKKNVRTSSMRGGYRM